MLTVRSTIIVTKLKKQWTLVSECDVTSFFETVLLIFIHNPKQKRQENADNYIVPNLFWFPSYNVKMRWDEPCDIFHC